MWAQAATDPGWFSLILQAGAFGILAYIVAVGFPRYSRELREERQQRDALFATLVETMQVRFAERNKIVVQALEELLDGLKHAPGK